MYVEFERVPKPIDLTNCEDIRMTGVVNVKKRHPSENKVIAIFRNPDQAKLWMQKVFGPVEIDDYMLIDLFVSAELRKFK